MNLTERMAKAYHEAACRDADEHYSWERFKTEEPDIYAEDIVRMEAALAELRRTPADSSDQSPHWIDAGLIKAKETKDEAQLSLPL